MRRRRFLQLGSLAALGSWSAFADAHGKAGGRVVIAGGGFAGSSCALYLKRTAPKLDVRNRASRSGRAVRVAACVCDISHLPSKKS